MAVDQAALLARFPEFQQAPAALLTSSIAHAQKLVDREVFGARADQAIVCMAAHLVATNPLGEMAKLEATKDGSTTYLVEFNRLRRACATGWRLT